METSVYVICISRSFYCALSASDARVSFCSLRSMQQCREADQRSVLGTPKGSYRLELEVREKATEAYNRWYVFLDKCLDCNNSVDLLIKALDFLSFEQ